MWNWDWNYNETRSKCFAELMTVRAYSVNRQNEYQIVILYHVIMGFDYIMDFCAIVTLYKVPYLKSLRYIMFIKRARSIFYMC